MCMKFVLPCSKLSCGARTQKLLTELLRATALLWGHGGTGSKDIARLCSLAGLMVIEKGQDESFYPYLFVGRGEFSTNEKKWNPGDESLEEEGGT